MKKLLYVLVLTIVSTSYSTAQLYYKTHSCKNTIKLSLSSLALGNVHIKYERAYNERWSAQLSLGKYLPTDLIKRLENRNFSWKDYELDLQNFNELEFYGNYLTIPEIILNGFYTQGEIRWYAGKKEALKGFYLAPFYSYHIATLNNIEAQDEQEYIYNGNVGFRYVGGGLQAGMQWRIKKFLIIDFNFLGLGAARMKNKVSYSTDNPYVNYETQIDDFENFVTQELQLKPKHYQISSKNNQLEYHVKLTAPVIRSGVSVGVVF